MNRIERISDRLSPMLVKELRQGLKTRAFSASFLILQLLMVVCLFVYLAEAAKENDLRFVNGMFWFFCSIPLLFVTPFRGFASIHEEVKAGTLDLIFLTRLTAWRIALGKWASLMFQTSLFVVGILPYAVLRYFLGGINLAQDLEMLALLLGYSAVLTAVGVGLSPFTSKVARGLVIAGSIMVFWYGSFAMAAMKMASVARMRTGWIEWAGGLVLGAVVVVFFLEFAASRIAPPAENHALRKRLLGLVILAILGVLSIFSSSPAFISIGLLLMMPVCVDALCETPVMLKSVYLPFFRKKGLLRFIGRFLVGGWPSGVLLTLLVFGLGGVILFANEGFDGTLVYVFVACLGSLLAPLAIIRVTEVRPDRTVVVYIGLQAFFMFVGVILLIFKEVFSISAVWWGSFIPTACLLLAEYAQKSTISWIGPAIAMAAGSLLILTAKMIPYWRRVAHMFNEPPPARAPAVSPQEGPPSDVRK